jgi:hypothetical protein
LQKQIADYGGIKLVGSNRAADQEALLNQLRKIWVEFNKTEDQIFNLSTSSSLSSSSSSSSDFSFSAPIEIQKMGLQEKLQRLGEEAVKLATQIRRLERFEVVSFRYDYFKMAVRLLSCFPSCFLCCLFFCYPSYSYSRFSFLFFTAQKHELSTVYGFSDEQLDALFSGEMDVYQTQTFMERHLRNRSSAKDDSKPAQPYVNQLVYTEGYSGPTYQSLFPVSNEVTLLEPRPV